MALVLAAMGFFVYLRVGDALLASVDQNLRAQAVESADHLGRGRGVIDRDAERAGCKRRIRVEPWLCRSTGRR